MITGYPCECFLKMSRITMASTLAYFLIIAQTKQPNIFACNKNHTIMKLMKSSMNPWNFWNSHSKWVWGKWTKVFRNKLKIVNVTLIKKRWRMLTPKVDKKLKPKQAYSTLSISTDVPNHITSEKTANRYKATQMQLTQIMKNHAIRQSLFFTNSC